MWGPKCTRPGPQCSTSPSTGPGGGDTVSGDNVVGKKGGSSVDTG